MLAEEVDNGGEPFTVDVVSVLGGTTIVSVAWEDDVTEDGVDALPRADGGKGDAGIDERPFAIPEVVTVVSLFAAEDGVLMGIEVSPGGIGSVFVTVKAEKDAVLLLMAALVVEVEVEALMGTDVRPFTTLPVAVSTVAVPAAVVNVPVPL